MSAQLLDSTFETAFPDDERGPTPVKESALGFRVPLTIASKLRRPELDVRGRLASFAAGVAVPEASVNEYGSLEAGQDKIRTSRKIAAVKPETKATRMQFTPHLQFRRGMPVPNRSHKARSSIRREVICHVGSISTVGDRDHG